MATIARMYVYQEICISAYGGFLYPCLNYVISVRYKTIHESSSKNMPLNLYIQLIHFILNIMKILF